MKLFLHKTSLILEMIKFEHTIFAMPFAMISVLLASRHLPHGLPSGHIVFWVIIAMIGARSAAMSCNRLTDAEIDKENPRTSSRHIPAGLLSKTHVAIFLAAAIIIFELAAWQLNPICFLLSPFAMLAVLGYSYTKRFTSLCHILLGFAIGIAPIGAWLAVRGSLSPVPLLLGAAVMLWIGGFDIIYALQDYEVDLKSRLHSIPKALGKKNALTLSRFMHLVMIGLLLGIGKMYGLHQIYFLGVGVVSALIIYEHLLVKPDDLRRVNMAFFTLNGWVSVSLFGFVLLDDLLFK